MSHNKRKEILTTCPFCGVGCNFYLQVEAERIIGIAPSRNHPVSRGRLCVKGWNAFEFIYHPDRLKRPLIKKGKKFKEVSWEEAEDFVARNLKRVRREFGSEKIGVISSSRSTNEENYLIQKFARAVLGTNNVDHCARTCHSPSVAGLKQSFGSEAATNSIDELADSKCIFVIGSNPLKAHPMIGWRILTAKDKGAKLIVADSRSSDLAKFADIHLKLLPGTEIALINALMNVILKNELEDKDFIHDRTENLNELRETLEKYTPFYAQKITSVPKGDIIRAAKMFVAHKPAVVCYSLGMTEHTAGAHNVMSLANLVMLTGNIGFPGSGVNSLRGQNNVQGACDLGALPNVFPGYQSVEDEHIRSRFQRHWKAKLPLKKGLGNSDMFERAGKIKAFYIVGEDVVLSEPDSKHVIRCLEKAEFVVVQDIFMNETAKFADVILPASTFAEKDGTFTNVDRRVQLVRRAIDPLYHTRPDSSIISGISKKLGAKGMNYQDSAAVMDEIAELVPIYGGISHERLEKQHLQWPCWNKTHLGTPFLHKGRFARGRGRFFGIEYKPAKEKTTKAYPFILSTGEILSDYSAGGITRRTTILDREHPGNFIQISKDDAGKLGIKSGCDVEVITRRGSLTVKAYVTDEIMKGVVWMPINFTEKLTNRLAVDVFDPLAKIGGYKVCAANIKLKK